MKNLKSTENGKSAPRPLQSIARSFVRALQNGESRQQFPGTPPSCLADGCRVQVDWVCLKPEVKKSKSLARLLVFAFAMAANVIVACSPSPDNSDAAKSAIRPEVVLETMKRATTFMREKVAFNGGYVWSYSSDLSMRWGEMQAYPTMIWIQPPGTASVGHVYLDAFYATGDRFYYDAAVEVGLALIAAQHPSGGWNYFYDFAGEESTRRWYDTIGKNGWRLEEFHHYYDNATFDDAGTAEAAKLMLRLSVESDDERFEDALEKSVLFILNSQYDNGGWPQRYPFVGRSQDLHDTPDYTRHITFNDDVAANNIDFLLLVWQLRGDERAVNAVHRAMRVYAATQQSAPQPGWGLQHVVDDLSPIGARSYEPNALATHTTAANISLMMDFFEWTGDESFIKRIPEALKWLSSVQLADGDVQIPGRSFPTFIEIGTNRPLINHRRGSNVVNGEYYQDYDPENPIAHYSQWRSIDLAGLQHRYEHLLNTSKAEFAGNSPLNRQIDFELPKFFANTDEEVSDFNALSTSRSREQVEGIVSGLNQAGYWPTPLRAVTNPYAGDGGAAPVDGDFGQTFVGDDTDTSPYISDDPKLGISVSQFIDNMTTLIKVVDETGK